ncbi:cystathionine beta-synthase [Klebsiella pneumoniae]|nr:cystathionine beta-synthase [Klebsiella pneumoniae]
MVMSLFHSVSDLIGHTPLLQLHKLVDLPLYFQTPVIT